MKEASEYTGLHPNTLEEVRRPRRDKRCETREAPIRGEGGARQDNGCYRERSQGDGYLYESFDKETAGCRKLGQTEREVVNLLRSEKIESSWYVRRHRFWVKREPQGAKKLSGLPKGRNRHGSSGIQGSTGEVWVRVSERKPPLPVKLSLWRKTKRKARTRNSSKT